ncbi:MAG: hypothetical protein WCK08_10665, partial [Betaproteobacteria bacterium]
QAQARQLSASAPGKDLSQALDEPGLWTLAAADAGADRTQAPELAQALFALAQRAWAMSELIGRRHFSHAGENRSVGA